MAAALAALGVVASACGESPPKQPAVEDLLGPLDQARHDSALAAAAAAAVGLAPQIAAALTVVATQRAAHARALSTEIFRAAGKLTSSSSETTQPEPQPHPGGRAPTATAAGVRRDRRAAASAESASRLVATSSGYRAGLLGSIAASCTASYTVALGGSAVPDDHDPRLAKDADNAALCDALAVEHSTIYGYGIVSALSPPGVNNLVVDALIQHRQRRDDVIAMLAARKVTAPVAAAGYQLPMLVGSARRCGAPGRADGERRRDGVARRDRARRDGGRPRVRLDGPDPERGAGRPVEPGAGRLAHHDELSRAATSSATGAAIASAAQPVEAR